MALVSRQYVLPPIPVSFVLILTFDWLIKCDWGGKFAIMRITGMDPRVCVVYPNESPGEKTCTNNKTIHKIIRNVVNMINQAQILGRNVKYIECMTKNK